MGEEGGSEEAFSGWSFVCSQICLGKSCLLSRRQRDVTAVAT